MTNEVNPFEQNYYMNQPRPHGLRPNDRIPSISPFVRTHFLYTGVLQASCKTVLVSVAFLIDNSCEHHPRFDRETSRLVFVTSDPHLHSRSPSLSPFAISQAAAICKLRAAYLAHGGSILHQTVITIAAKLIELICPLGWGNGGRSSC